MVNRISIRPFLFGSAAVLLAYLGQRALRINSFFDAVLPVWQRQRHLPGCFVGRSLLS